MTTQKVRTNVYLNADIKNQAKELFQKYGLGLSDAINIFLSQSVYSRGIPFEISLPNIETENEENFRTLIQDIKSKKAFQNSLSSVDFFNKLEND